MFIPSPVVRAIVEMPTHHASNIGGQMPAKALGSIRTVSFEGNRKILWKRRQSSPYVHGHIGIVGPGAPAQGRILILNPVKTLVVIKIRVGYRRFSGKHVYCRMVLDIDMALLLIGYPFRGEIPVHYGVSISYWSRPVFASNRTLTTLPRELVMTVVTD